MLRVMNIKLMRDLWRQRIQCLAIVMIVACGVASQITSFSLIATLNSAMQVYYESSRFPDLFVHMEALPISQVDRLRSISGITAIQPRIVVDCPLQVSEEPDDPATATLIAVPEAFDGSLNRLVIRRGKQMSELTRNEILVSEVFAEARRLKMGAILHVTVQGERRELKVGGIAISPEYLFQIRDGAGVPDNRRFAVLWMRYEDLALATNLSGMFNDVVMTRKDVSPFIVKERIAQVLANGSTLSMTEREMQVSHRYTVNAIRQLYSVAIVPPAIFLAVASFLIYIATSRLVKMERENIAMQRAFGYSAWDVGIHYFKYVMLVVMVGCLAGILGGILLATKAIGIYNEIYRFPELPLCVSSGSLAFSIFASSVAGWVGGGYSVWSVASMPPAQGLRPEPPASYRLSWYDQVAAWLMLSPISRMVLRGLGRWPLRTALGVLGIALGIGVMILGSYTQGAISYVVDFEFYLTRRYDVMVQFVPGTSEAAIDELQRFPGVLYPEGFESGRFLIRSGHIDRCVTVLGISEDHTLMQPVTLDLRPVQLHGHGIALSSKLAQALKVEIGSTVEVVPLSSQKKPMELRVEYLVTDYAGLNAYVTLADFQRWYRDGESVQGALLQVDSNQMHGITRALHQCPKVMAVTIKNAALENFQANDSKNLLLFRVFNMLFSSVIGIGAVYSVASISMIERQRDLALLRVLGYSAAETGRVLIGELLVMSAMAIPVGCFSGYLFATIATWMLNSETQRIPLLVQPEAYGSSVVVSLASCLISAFIIQHRVNNLDCIAQLKSKD